MNRFRILLVLTALGGSLAYFSYGLSNRDLCHSQPSINLNYALAGDIIESGFLNRFSWADELQPAELVASGLWKRVKIEGGITPFGDRIEPGGVEFVYVLKVRGESFFVYLSSCGDLLRILK